MGVLRNANYIKNVYRHQCDTPNPTILIETAVEAAIPVLFVPFQFSCLDIVKLRAGISWKCGKSLKAIAKTWHPPGVIDKTHFLYTLGAAQAEAALWYWFIADLGTEFIANWMTLIYAEQGCQLPGGGQVQTSVSSLFLFAGGPYTVLLGADPGHPCVSVGVDTVTIKAGCQGSISWSAEWVPFLGDPVNQGSVTTWLERSDGKRFDVVTGNGGAHGQKQITGGGVKVYTNPLTTGDVTYKPYWSLDKGLMGIKTGSLTVTTEGKRIQLFPTSCNVKDPYAAPRPPVPPPPPPPLPPQPHPKFKSPPRHVPKNKQPKVSVVRGRKKKPKKK